jgi:hypothetical protein
MFWWFEREGTYRRCEILTVGDGAYELRLVDEDGEERIEQFSDTVALRDREQKVIADLAANGWSGPHGWVL